MTVAQASPDSFALQGQIVTPAGDQLEAASVDFLVQVYSPLPNKCLLYEESFSSVNMTGSKGLFSLKVGTGTQSGSDFEDSSSLTAILNNQGGALTPTTCEAGGPNYTPGSSDNRLLRLTFNDGSGAVTLADDHVVSSVPFAQYAKSVEGLGAADIIKVNIGTAVLSQANLETIFAAASDVTDLRNLIDGNSGDYLSSTPTGSVGFNNQRVTDVATPTLGSDATNKNYVDGNVGGNTINTGVLGAGENGQVLTWNGTQWVSQALSASGDVNNGGNTFGGLMTLGTDDAFGLVLETNNTPAVTIDGSQGVSMAAGLGVTGGINAGGDINLLTESELRFQDAAGGEYMGLKAPATVTANIILTLPDGDGGANQVLATDGSGQLIWANDANTDAVDTVFGRAGTVVAATSDYDAVQVDNTPAGAIAATNAQAAIDELDSEKLAKAGDGMSGNLNMLGESEVRFEDNAGGDFIGFKAPATVTASATFILPDGDGAASQVLQTDGSLGLQWVTLPSAGETNTADNIGTAGVGVYATKVGAELRFKNVNAASSKVTVANDAGNNEIDIDVAEGQIDHDALLNFVANEHTDHSSIDVATAAGSGLSGGGDLTATRNLTLDIPGVADLGTAAIGADSLLIYDSANTALKEVTRTELVLSEAEVDAFANNNGYAADSAVLKKDGSVGLTGAWDIGGTNKITNMPAPTAGGDAVNKTYADTKVALSGDTMSGSLNLDNEAEIQLSEADGNGANYVGFKAPALVAADIIWTLPGSLGSANQVLANSSTPGVLEWVTPVGSDHGALTGRSDDDHSQYALLLGRSGGQSLIGGTGASDDLTIESSSNATKGDVLINSSGGNVGVGTTSAATLVDIRNSGDSATTLQVVNTNVGSSAEVNFRATTDAGSADFGMNSVSDGGEAYLWNVATTDLIMGTDNLQRMAIKADGDIGIGTNTPEATALVDMFSTTKGALIPRMSTAQRDAIVTPADGLQIYNTTTSQLNYYNSSAWQALGIAGAGLTTLNTLTGSSQSFAPGTAGTDFAISSVGTTHTFNIPTASGTNRGALSSANWTTFNDKLTSTLAGGQIFVGDGSNDATAVAVSGDIAMTNAGVVTVGKLQNRDVAATLPTDTQVLKWNNGGSTWEPAADLVLTEVQVDGFANNNGYAAAADVVAKAGDTMTGNLVMDNEVEVRFREATGNGTDSVGFKAPAALGADVTWTLPDAIGAANQVLTTSSTPGILEWSTPTTGTGDFKADGTVAMTGDLNLEDQSLLGGTTSGDDLTIESTSHATKGDILLAPSGGNVGIGTTAASNGYALQVDHPSSYKAARFANLGSGDTGIEVGTNGITNRSWVFFEAGASDFFLSSSATGGRFSIISGNNINANTERLVIESSGNVGVGANAPGTKLDVEGRITSGPIDATAGNTGSIVFEELAANGTESVGFRAPDVLAADLMWTLPSVTGAANEVLQNNGSGILQWAALPSVSSELDDLSDATTDYANDNLFLGSGSGAAVAGGLKNLAIGESAMPANTSGDQNIAIGFGALTATAVNLDNNLGIGSNSLWGAIGGDNVAIGTNALFNNSGGTGASNVAIGFQAGHQSSGSSNVFVGDGSGIGAGGTGVVGVGGSALTGSVGNNNIGVGFAAGYNSSGVDNIAIGNNAYFFNGGASTGQENVHIGNQSAGINTSKTGNKNTAVGYRTHNLITSGANNTSMGADAADNLTTGSNNITLGQGIDVVSPTADNQLNIGNTIYGDLSSDSIGIGTTIPGTKLDVEGRITAGPIDAAAGNTGSIIFEDSDGTNSSGIRAADVTTADYLLTLPATAGSVNQVLSNTATPGVLAWTTPTTGTGDFKADGSVAMTGNLQTGGSSNWISNDGDSEGINIHTNGNVGIQASGTSSYALNVSGVIRSVDGGVLTEMNNTANTRLQSAIFRRRRSDATAPGLGFEGSLEFALEGFTDSTNVPSTNMVWGWELTQSNDTTDRDSFLSFETLENASLSEKLRISSAGMVGIGTNAPGTKLDVEGRITAGPIDATTGNTGSIVLEELAATGTNTVGLRAPDALAADLMWTLPNALGTANQVLRNSGTPGILEWSTPTTGAGDFLANGTVAMTGDLDLGNRRIENVILGTQALPAISFNGDPDTGIWSSGANTLDFSTGGSRAMVIDSSGNVGIGSNTPGNALDVIGNIHVGGGAEGLTLYADGTDSTVEAASNHLVLKTTRVDASYSDIIFNHTNSGGTEEWMRIKGASGGRVGIGIPAPVLKLDIDGGLNMRERASPGTSAADMGRIYFDTTLNRFRVSENGGGYVDLVNTSNGDFLASGTVPMTGNLNLDGNLLIGGTGAGNDLSLEPTTHATKGDILLAQSGGDVGIGTNNPNRTLEVRDDQTGYTGVRATNMEPTAGGGTGAEFNAQSNAGNASFGIENTVNGGEAYVWNEANTQLRFATNDTLRMAITAGGNVGIGTDTPGAKLDLNGGMSFRGFPTGAGPTPVASEGKIFFDSTLNKFQISQNNGAYTDLIPTTGSGSGDFKADGSVAMTGDLNLEDQSLIGGTTAADNLTLDSTSNGTKGDILLAPSGGEVGVGTTAASYPVHIFRSAADSTLAIQAETGDFDPTIKFIANNTDIWSVGIDDDDADKFKVSYNSALGTNDFLEIEENGTVSMSGSQYIMNGSTEVIHFSNSNNIAATPDIQFEGSGLMSSESLMYFHIDSDNTGTGASFVFNKDGDDTATATEIMRLTEDGVLGIGTASPDGILHLHGFNQDIFHTSIATGATLGPDLVWKRANDAGAGSPGVIVDGDKLGGLRGLGYDGAAYWPGAEIQFLADGAPQAADIPAKITFATQTDGVGFSEKMVIKNDGDVGIGTDTPGTKLDLAGALSMREMAVPADSPVDEGRIYFDSSANKFKVSENNGTYVDLIPSSGAGAGDFLADGTVPVTGNLRLNGNYLSGDGGSEGVFVNSNGDVGIGTNTPAAKLHVDASGAGGGVCVTSDGTCGAVPTGGQISAETTLNTGADYAEYFEAEETLVAGELVGLNTVTGLVRGYRAGDKLLGVVSTNPGVIGNSELGNSKNAVLVALVGQVPVIEKTVREESGTVFTIDGQSLGYRLGNGNVFLNLSTGNENLIRKVSSLTKENKEIQKNFLKMQKRLDQMEAVLNKKQ